ncbi:MAG: ankyrin repeat domain-containing protein [Bryobacterales bacterium]|nr:ankyrin repeat domain-containing protein [Bryobacterales bacterium]
MAEHADDIFATGEFDQTALHIAADRGNVQRIHDLLRRGADLEARDLDGNTPLMLAVSAEEPEAVNRLLEAGADITTQNFVGDTPLHLAALNADPDLTARLLEANANPNLRNEQDRTPLHSLATGLTPNDVSRPPIETMELLVHSRADINSQDRDGNTALHYVARGRSPEADRIAEAMLQQGASSTVQNIHGLTPYDTTNQPRERPDSVHADQVKDTIIQYDLRTDTRYFARKAGEDSVASFQQARNYPRTSSNDLDHHTEEDIYDRHADLHFCAAAGDHKSVDQLLKEGANPNTRDPNGRTSLHEAVDAGHYKTVDRLLNGGADPNIQDDNLRQSPLHRAVESENEPITNRLLLSRADPNLRDAAGDTPLHAALRSPHMKREPLATLNAMIAHDAKLDMADMQERSTPLHIAAQTDKLKVAERLLDQLAKPNLEDKNGNTPLHNAAMHSDEMTQTLLHGGADPHHQNHKGMTPLHHAALGNQPAAATHLIERGSDPDSRNSNNQTPLHLAAYCGAHETVKNLITRGANVHARDEYGETPLHEAAIANCTKSIDHLLKAGADPKAHVPGKIGTPLEQAQGFGNTEAVERLTQAETARDNTVRSIGRRLFSHVADRIPKPNNDQDSRIIHKPHKHHRKENSMPQEHWSNSKSARQFTEQVAERVAKQVEQGKAPWQKGWDKPKGADLQPFNPATLKRFKGLNSVQLRSVAEEKGYNDPRWMSFQAANQIGAKIRKGERGTRVEYLRFPPKSADKDAPSVGADGKLKEPPKISHHTYTVFNAEQIEKMPPLEEQLAKEPQQHEICERAERMIEASGVKIEQPEAGQSHSYYDKSKDAIVMPDVEKFKSPEAYYGQAVKEMTNQAGHKAQQDRSEPQNEAQQNKATARQDMRSEMACLTINEKLHLPKEPTGERHQKQWAETIRKNPNELRYAARDADQIADQVLKHDRPQQRQQSEPPRETVAAAATPERMMEAQRQLQQPQQEMAAMSR